MAALRRLGVLLIMQYMKATLILNRRETLPNGLLLETVVWWVPAPVPGSTHRFKYRLYCGRDGVCLVRYDNERGKGDHRHEGGRETPYAFVSVDHLMDDFMADVTRLGGPT